MREFIAETNYISSLFFKIDSVQGRQVCNVEVWEKPASQGTEITKFECEEKPYVSLFNHALPFLIKYIL